MLPEIGPVELILILVIVTMLFGVGKLPEVFGAVGRGVREFRSAMEAQDAPQPHATPAEAPDSSLKGGSPQVI
jgi:sec-independent protein translocase protein TatA